jgi:glycosyltransferase involved in cell wall biosynthesis
MTTISKIIPDISVVMSVYNNADTLVAAMDSVLRQEGVELEFIVIDDGSTDGSAAMLDDYAGWDPRVMVIHRDNQGLTASLIHGCALARGTWIARQDADDVSLPGRLRKQLDAGASSGAPVLVGCHARYFTSDGDVLFDYVPPDNLRERIVQGECTVSPHGSILFRRDAYTKIGGYRAAFYYAQDLDLNIRLAAQGAVAVVPEVLYNYTFSPNAISGVRQREQGSFRDLILASLEARATNLPDDDMLTKANALSMRIRNEKPASGAQFGSFYFLGCCLLRSNPQRARKYFAEALALQPWSLKSMIRWLQSFTRRSVERT